MDFFSQTIVAIRGPTGAPQTPLDTIGRLSDRLSPSTLLADRRAAVLSLKGLVRDHKKIAGEQALSGLLEIIQNDAEVDRDIGKAALETVNFLCDVVDMESDQRELGYAHSDRVLENQRTAHKLFFLLGGQDFHVRYGSCVLLTTLLHNRPQATQAYFLNAPIGPTPVVSLLGESREMMKRGKSIDYRAILCLRSARSRTPACSTAQSPEHVLSKASEANYLASTRFWASR